MHELLPELLVLVAIGEPADDEGREHEPGHEAEARFMTERSPPVRLAKIGRPARRATRQNDESPPRRASADGRAQDADAERRAGDGTGQRGIETCASTETRDIPETTSAKSVTTERRRTIASGRTSPGA